MRDSYLLDDLHLQRKKLRSTEEELINQVKQILYNDQFSEKHILNHLKKYNKKFELLNEDEVNQKHIFTSEEIKNTCVKFQLRFLPSNVFELEFPYEVILKIKDLNSLQRKDLQHFYILGESNSFLPGQRLNENFKECLLFCKTEFGNYYLIHRWGKAYGKTRLLRSFPLRNFESLFLCVIAASLLVTLLLPTRSITNDTKAEYFSMYRIACFFHVLIIHIGFTVFAFLGFNQSFSEQNFDSTRLSVQQAKKTSN